MTTTQPALEGSDQNPVVILREGGDLTPRPHPWRIMVFADGRIRTLSTERRVPPERVRDLLRQLRQLGLPEIDSAGLVDELKAAGEFQQIIEGGHGCVTIDLRVDGQDHSVTLAHPEVYQKTTVQSVQRFLQAIAAVRALAAGQDQP
ncbi:MAG: hypothetical protein HY718_02305 [Planctomycetes bacterium]|nr:hypothetical protein [Planctomycetota bacterium]